MTPGRGAVEPQEGCEEAKSIPKLFWRGGSFLLKVSLNTGGILCAQVSAASPQAAEVDGPPGLAVA